MRALCLWLLCLTAACSPIDDAQLDAVLALDGDAANGADLYQSSCASCHGQEGEGGSGPSLVDHVPDHDDAALVKALLRGPFSMPSFADWPDQDLADMLAHLRDAYGDAQ